MAGETGGTDGASRPNLRWQRVLLKLSGEAFAAEHNPDPMEGGEPKRELGSAPRVGLNYGTIRAIASEVVQAHQAGVEIAIVIGAGNIVRGERAAEAGMERAAADYMGMLGTVINSMALQDALGKAGRPHTRDERDCHGRSCRTFYTPPRHPASGKRPRGRACGRNRQPLLYDGHGCGPARQ